MAVYRTRRAYKRALTRYRRQVRRAKREQREARAAYRKEVARRKFNVTFVGHDTQAHLTPALPVKRQRRKAGQA